LGNAFTTLGQAVTWLLGLFTDMGTTLLENPIFLVSMAIFVIGAIIGLVFRAVKNR